MLLTVISALLGAYLGMSSRSRLMAALIAAALAGAAHYVLLYASAILLALAAEPAGLERVLTAVGVRGYGLTYNMGSAAAAALVAGILLGLKSPRARDSGARQHRASPELERISDVLSA
jgi:acetolactate synthase regulatory subunit